jgi:predicted peptidase
MLKFTHPLLSLLFASLLFFIACKSDDMPVPVDVRTFEDVEVDFQAIDLSPGVHDVSLEILNGVIYNFRVIAPERATGEERPFMIALHGASTSPDAHKNTACYVEPGLDTLNAFILSPNGEGGLWYTDENQEMMATLIFLVRKYWPIDEDRMAVTGYSNGGNGSWLFGQFQSSLLSAAIPMASSYDLYNTDSSVIVFDIPIYAIHGENDELFPVDVTQGWIDASNDAGSDITFVVAPGLGHYTPCDYVPYLQEAAIWLKETVWME